MAATDSPGGPPIAGDHPQRDRSRNGLVHIWQLKRSGTLSTKSRL